MIYVENKELSLLIAKTPYCVTPYCVTPYYVTAVLAERQIVIWQKVLIFCLSNGADTRI